MFNYYSDRLDISLPTRLIKESFPCHYLFEQRRMHPVLSDYPNREIYRGKLVNGPGRSASLNEQMPGLRKVLADVIGSSI